jgi:RNA recognition motif-containing protein
VIENRLPPNLRLIPYDTLLEMFESALPPQLYLLVPSSTVSIGQTDRPTDRTKLYVGGIPYSMTTDELQDAFAKAGAVVSVSIVMDKLTARSRGFGFVEMASRDDAEVAIEMWNGKDLDVGR